MNLDFKKQENIDKYYVWAWLQIDVLPLFEDMVKRDEIDSFWYLKSHIDDFEDCETSEEVYEEIINWDNSAEFEAWIIAGKRASVYFLKEILWQ